MSSILLSFFSFCCGCPERRPQRSSSARSSSIASVYSSRRPSPPPERSRTSGLEGRISPSEHSETRGSSFFSPFIPGRTPHPTSAGRAVLGRDDHTTTSEGSSFCLNTPSRTPYPTTTNRAQLGGDLHSPASARATTPFLPSGAPYSSLRDTTPLIVRGGGVTSALPASLRTGALALTTPSPSSSRSSYSSSASYSPPLRQPPPTITGSARATLGGETFSTPSRSDGSLPVSRLIASAPPRKPFPTNVGRAVLGSGR